MFEGRGNEIPAPANEEFETLVTLQQMNSKLDISQQNQCNSQVPICDDGEKHGAPATQPVIQFEQGRLKQELMLRLPSRTSQRKDENQMKIAIDVASASKTPN